MKRTFCAIIRDPRAEAVLAPYGEAMAKARHWQFREIHIKERKVLDVRKEAQEKFGLTKRQANSNEFDLDQAVAAWRGNLEYRKGVLEDRIDGIDERLKRIERKLADPKTTAKKKKQLDFTTHQKKRHLATTKATLHRVVRDLSGKPNICFGGRKPLRDGNLEEWHDKRTKRFILVGSTGESGGNQTAQYDPVKRNLMLRLPDSILDEAREALPDAFDARGRIVLQDIRFRYGQEDVADALKRDVALTWLFFRDEEGRWHAHVTVEQEPTELKTSIRVACVGIDVNVDHLAVVVSDRYGNPIDRKRFPFPEQGTDSGVSTAMIGDAVRDICALAIKHHAGVAAEDLDFKKKKAALKEYGKAHARRLSSFAYGKLRDMLVSRCGRDGVDLHFVNPAFTSVIGGLKYAVGRSMTRHESAALVIARRAQGFSERFVCMHHKALVGPGRNRSRHLWSRWRNARLKAFVEGNSAAVPRLSAGGRNGTGKLPVIRPDKAVPTSRAEASVRNVERTGSAPRQVRSAVVRANRQ